MSEGIFSSVLAALLVLAIPYLFRLHEISDALKKSIGEAAIWDANAFPQSIAHIEANENWRLIVRGFYKEADGIVDLVPKFICAKIFIFSLGIGVSIFSDRMRNVYVRPEVSLSLLIQIIILAIASLWVIYVVVVVNMNSKKKSNIETIVRGIKIGAA